MEYAQSRQRIGALWWQSTFDSHVVPDIAVTDWLQSHHYAGSLAVLWNSSDEWVSPDHPAAHHAADRWTPLNDDVMLGSRPAIGPYVAHHRPQDHRDRCGERRPAGEPSFPCSYSFDVAVHRVGPYVVYVRAAVSSKGRHGPVGDPGSAV